jgi:hypothetical protein
MVREIFYKKLRIPVKENTRAFEEAQIFNQHALKLTADKNVHPETSSGS